MKNGILYSIITALIFVTFEPVSKLIANDISPYAITFWRFLLGSLILLIPAIIKIRKEKIRITPGDMGKMSLLGILFVCISMLALQFSIKEAPSPSLVAIIFSSNSIFTIIFAVLINREKLTKNKVIALVLGIIGVILCADFSSGTNINSLILGLVAALTFSLYTVLTQKYSKKLSGVIQTGFVFFIGSLILLVILLFMKVDLTLPRGAFPLSILAYVSVVVTGIGYAAYFKAIEKGGAIMASLAFFIKPILTPFVTLVINNIVPDAKVFIAVFFIVVASYFAVYYKKSSQS